MSIKLQLRRGLETDLPTLAAGEPGFCTDSYKLFIGSAAGGNREFVPMNLPNTTGATVGVIQKGGASWLHDYSGASVGGNVFLGGLCGNFALTGPHNTGVGFGNLYRLTSGDNNAAFGHGALYWLTTGGENTGLGTDAMRNKATGNFNVAVGASALHVEDGGSYNVAVGAHALGSATLTNQATAIGYEAGGSITTGGINTVFVGFGAGYSATTGANNSIFLGKHAGYYETGESKLFIDSYSRASEADGRIKALIYGVFDALTANQRLSFNGRILVRECPNYANNAAALAGGLTSGELYTVTGTDPLQVAKVV